MKDSKVLLFLKGLFSRNEIIFGLCFAVIFFITFTSLYVTGLIPTEFKASADDTPSIIEQIQDSSFQQLGLSDVPAPVAQNTASTKAEASIRIEAPSISLNSIIVNPASTDYTTLDNALVKGAVHYPGSGNVEGGNMFIFGHSTSYKVVNNKAYQVFNNIHSLTSGDEINVYTANKKYTYKVTTVRLADSREVLVDFDNSQRMLTLSTCNSFGAKTDRYVVQAVFDHSIDI